MARLLLLSVLEVDSESLYWQMFKFKKKWHHSKSSTSVYPTQGSINGGILASGIGGSENKKYLVFAEILFAEHTLSEEIILNKVSLRGIPTIILPWSYMGWHRRCHKITNAHTSASQTATKEQTAVWHMFPNANQFYAMHIIVFFTLFY